MPFVRRYPRRLFPGAIPGAVRRFPYRADVHFNPKINIFFMLFIE